MASNQNCNKIIYAGRTLVDLTGDTITAADVRAGVIFHLPNGSVATGTMNEGERVYYGACSTAAATQAKAVTISGITALTAGLSIRVKFANAQTYNGNPTLNLNSLGPVSIKRNGTTDAARYEWQAGEVLDFVYDGTYWIIVNGGAATTTYNGETKLSSSVSSTSEAQAATSKVANLLAKDFSDVEASTTASKAYIPGQFFVYAGQLYKVTAEIASGGTITPGTNCTASSFSAEYKDHEEKIKAANTAAMDNFLHLRSHEQKIEKTETTVEKHTDNLTTEMKVVELTNTASYPFNNSIKTVALATARDALDYTVDIEVPSKVSNIGNLLITEKQLNGFKISYDGSAKSVSVRLTIKGGFNT